MSQFFVLEGVEGAGKGTVLAGLIERFRAEGVDLVVSREPGGTPMAEEIRHVLLAARDEPVAPDTELLLMFASRAQHLDRLIRPALAAGQTLLLDRFTDASYAYQGVGRGLGAERVEQLEALVQGDLRPDCVLVLDLDPEIGLARIHHNRRATDRMDGETLDFYRRVRAGYQARVAAAPQRYRLIDASGTPDQVLDAAWSALSEFRQ